MSDYTHKVIGFIGVWPNNRYVCTINGALIVGGAETTIKDLMKKIDPNYAGHAELKKVRFGEILEHLGDGARDAFDLE